MAEIEVYYFSGSGNSLAVAGDIARELGADLIPLASLRDRERIATDAEVVGFVCPIYDFKPPPLVEALAARIDGLAGKYLFAACTYGVALGGALHHLDGAVRQAGGRLSTGFGVLMPHNAIGSRELPCAGSGPEARQVEPQQASALRPFSDTCQGTVHGISFSIRQQRRTALAVCHT